MHANTYAFLLLAAIAFGCQSGNSEATVTEPSTNQVLPTPHVDTIVVRVDSVGVMTLGKKVTSPQNLAQALSDSVKAIQAKGQTQVPAFKLEVQGEGMLMGGRAEVRDIFTEVTQQFQQN